MSKQDPDWLRTGQGDRPRQRWAFTADAPLLSLELVRETGEILAADESGGLYLLDRRGKIRALSRGFHDLSSLTWSDTGTYGAALLDEATVCRFDRRFDVKWSITLYEAVTAVVISPYGNHVAVSMANGSNLILDDRKRKIANFETVRPLSFLQFVAEAPALLGAAEYGLICRHKLNGAEVWSEKLWSNVGDMSATGDGKHLYVAGFNRGIQAFALDGENTGSYVVEGTPNHISTSYMQKRIAATTLERHFYWLAAGGQMLWATHLPDDACRLLCDPRGEWVVCGFKSGRVVFLEW